ncbi:MAG: FtsX-like permease family protein [Bryobacteraceae bacterium]
MHVVAFGIAALLLAALGIYGVVAYGISLRRREMGVRMALGARAAQVRAMVLIRGIRPVAAGLAIGLATGRLIHTLLFGVAPSDALTLARVVAALACVAILACLLPARAAARIDPARVLRDE